MQQNRPPRNIGESYRYTHLSVVVFVRETSEQISLVYVPRWHHVVQLCFHVLENSLFRSQTPSAFLVSYCSLRVFRDQQLWWPPILLYVCVVPSKLLQKHLDLIFSQKTLHTVIRQRDKWRKHGTIVSYTEGRGALHCNALRFKLQLQAGFWEFFFFFFFKT